MPVANSLELVNWHPECEVSCHLPVADLKGKRQMATGSQLHGHQNLHLVGQKGIVV